MRTKPNGAGRGRGLAALTIVGALLLAWPARADAAEVMVQSSVVSQNYQVRNASNTPLTFSRLDTYLRLFALDLLPNSKDKHNKYETQINLVASIRLRADFRGFSDRWNSKLCVVDSPYGCDQTLELLFAHLSVTDLLGFIDLKLGRMFHMDPMDFYGYDGLEARFRLPYHIALEVLGGLRTSGRFALDAPIYLLEGTDLVDSRPGWLPMVSVGAETHGVSWLALRVAYRATWHVLDPNDPNALYPEDPTMSVPGTQMAEEKLSAFARTIFGKGKLQVYGGIRYNLLTTRLDEAQAGVASSLGKHSRLQAEYVMDSPDFDGDSIFNIFNTQSYQELRLWYEHRFTSRWSAYARFTVRLFEGGASDAPEETEQAVLEPDVGGGLGFTYVGKRITTRVDGYWQEGYGGRTLGLYAYYRHVVVPGWLSLIGRGVMAYWDDDLSITPKGVTAGLGAGARVRFGNRVALHVLLEDNFGTYNKSDVRLFALLNFSWCTRGSCPAGVVVP